MESKSKKIKVTIEELNMICNEVAKRVKLVTDVRTKLNGQQKDTFLQSVVDELNSIAPQVSDR